MGKQSQYDVPVKILVSVMYLLKYLFKCTKGFSRASSVLLFNIFVHLKKKKKGVNRYITTDLVYIIAR